MTRCERGLCMSCVPPGVGAAPGAVPGGGAAANHCVRGSGCVPPPGGLQAAAAGVKPPGGAAEGAPQRQPGRRAVRPQG